MTVSSAYAPEEEPTLQKLVILGDKGVGKRAFTIMVGIAHSLIPLQGLELKSS
jgi:hypothetical protein